MDVQIKRHTSGSTTSAWFDPRITISGAIQIVLLLVAVFKFGAEMDKRTSLIEQTLMIHAQMIKENHDTTMNLADSNRRIVTIIEQNQRLGRP